MLAEPALVENRELIPFTVFGRGVAIIDLDTGKPATKAAILAGQICLVQYGERSFTIRLVSDGRIEARCPKCR
jgi:hypothetical protein